MKGNWMQVFASDVAMVTFPLRKDASLPLRGVSGPNRLFVIRKKPNPVEVAQMILPNCSGIDPGVHYKDRVAIELRDDGCYLILKGLIFEDGGDYELRESGATGPLKSQIKLRITDDPPKSDTPKSDLPKSGHASGGPSKVLLLLCFAFAMALLL